MFSCHVSWHRYNNKTSYYFDKELGTCKEVTFPVGILTPDWLANATYLGTDSVDTYDTHVWTKSEGFIMYWADMKTGRPVSLSPSLVPHYRPPFQIELFVCKRLSRAQPPQGCQGRLEHTLLDKDCSTRLGLCHMQGPATGVVFPPRSGEKELHRVM